MEKLTIEQISKLAGVSQATVSRVINDYPHIRPEVREKVQRIIDETGYRPSVVARSLASDRSNVIGVVIPSAVQELFTDPYFPRLMQGISQTATARDLTLTLFIFHTREEEARTIRSVINTGLLDGLIIAANHKDLAFLPLLLDKKMPFVLIGRPHELEEQITFVNTDNIGGAYMATEHLINLGRARIGIITVFRNTAGDDRYEGFRRAMTDHNIPIFEDLVATGSFTTDSGYQAMKEILPGKPDAVFACSDAMALGAMRAIREAGLRIPQDIAVVGYDNLPFANQAEPPLTTIQQPIKETGATAVETLIDILGNGAPAQCRMVLPNQLMVRESCGAALRQTQ